MKKVLFFLMIALFCIPWAMRAQETLTVADGETTNQYVPVYGFYCDVVGTKSQTIYPASDLSDMAGGTISGLTYYLSSTAAVAWGAAFEVKLMEITESTFSSATPMDVSSATTVYTGDLDGTSSTMTFAFDQEFAYNGGNLLIDITVIQEGTYKGASFFGIAATNASYNEYDSYGTMYTNIRSFIPKTTFTYTPASTGCDMPTTIAVNANTITASGATVTWEGDGSAWNLHYKASSDADYTLIEGLTTTSYTFDNNLSGNTTYSVGVQTVCAESNSSFKSTSFTTANPCATPTNLQVSNITNNSATLTWTPGYQETQWTVRYKKSTETEYMEETVNGTPTITLNGLTTNTKYNVQVYNCENYLSVNFTTQAGIPLVEPFASSSVPTGWVRYSGLLSDVMNGTALTSYSGGWVFGTGNGVFDSHAKINIFGSNCKYWLVTPNLPMQDNVQLSFDLALTKYNGTLVSADPELQQDDKFVVLITTDGGDSWIILRQWDNAGSADVYNSIACSAVGQNVTIDLSSYAGQNIAVAFYGESTLSGGDNNLHIDNVSIDYIPSCAKPTGLAKSNVAGHTVDLSWTSDASAWVVAYKTSEDEEFTEVNVTENPYTLPGLTPETAYTAKVRANCGGAYSDWTNVVSFTTTVACPAPTGLTTVPDGYDAIFSWTGSADGYDVAFADNEDADPEDNIVDNNFTETNYVQYDLELGDYYFWVRANCGEEDGDSEWAGPTSVHIGYCVPGTTSRDGKGITGVNFGQGDYIVENTNTNGLPASSPYYGDYVNMVGAVNAGVESTIAITTSTSSYPYTFVIWVDYDNDMAFEDDEIVYTGKCNSGVGTLNATITVPSTQALGDYRMRIAGADSYFDSFYNNGNLNFTAQHNPCQTGSYFMVFHDYTLRVLEAPSCFTPTALTLSRSGDQITAEWVGTAPIYNIDINGTVTENVTSPYSFTADLSTTYTVTVQANCGGETSDWSNASSITTPDCWSGRIIEYTMNDSYGDGWNGAAILVKEGCDIVDTLTLSSGASANGTLELCGDYYEFIWKSGLYDGECSFTFTENETTLFEGEGGDYSEDPLIYTIGTLTCPSPTDLENEEPEAHSVVLSWTEGGSAEIWQICVNNDEENLIDVTENPYTLNLDPETYYVVKVRAKCGADEVSCWSDSVTFTTPAVCPKPTNLTAQNPGSTSVALRWYVNGDETAWQISTGDDENPIDVVVDDVSRTLTVIGGNSVTYLDYTLTGLTPVTEYTVKVRANCVDEDAVSDWSNPVTFTTLASCPPPTALDVAGVTGHEAEVSWEGSGESYVVSYRTAAYINGIEEEFNTMPEGWTRYSGALNEDGTGPTTTTTMGWGLGSKNGVFDNHTYMNIYSTNKYWLVTPAMSIDNDWTLNFDLAYTAYSGTESAPAQNGSDDRFVVLISIDEKDHWIILREWNNEDGSEYVLNNVNHTATGENVTIDLGSYAGQNAYIAFYGASYESNADNELHIDNVTIGTPVAAGDWDEVSTNELSTTLTLLAPETKYEVKVKAVCDGDVESEYSEIATFTTTEACPVPTVLTATATNNSAVLGWTANAGESAWTVYYKRAADPDFTAVPVTENPYTVELLDAATEYVFYVEANCSETETSEPSTTFSFTTPCEAQDITYTYDFEDAAPFICWTPIAGAAVVNGNSAHEGSNYLKFSGTTSNMIALPQFSNATNTLRLEFWTRPEDRTYPSCGSFSVGYMTDLEDASSFVAVATYAYNDWTSNIYEKKTVDFNEAPANAYIAMRQHDCAYNYYWYVDDVTVKEIPSCPAPTGLTVSYTGGDEATVSWTSEATAWNLDVNGTVIPVTENPYTLTDLTLATDYDVKVQAVCGSEVSEWTSTKSFTTDACMPAELTVVNYELTDAYGDGWNGNAIKVKNANCEEIGSLTIANGASASGTLRICGDYLSFEWKVGSYPGEASWSFTDANGNPLFSGTGSTNMATGDVIYTIGGISRPSRLVPANVASTHALLNWYENGEATTWQIMLNNDEEHLITTTNNPYALSGLTPETPYTYKVRSVNAGDTSTWSCSEGSFTTTACYTPSDLQAAVVGYQVALTWDAGSDETDWNIRYRKVGAADWNTATSDGEEYTFTGTPGSYEAGVQAVCAEGYESDWYSTQFTIDCHPVHLAYHKTACETYTWSAAEGGNGQIYTTSGTYFNPHADVYECEQVDTLYLTINNPVHLAYHKTACETYTWTAAEGGNGQTYTTSGTYYYPHADANQCEQVDTLYLTINNPVHLAYHKTECETYTWSAAEGGNGQTYATSGIYYYPHADANQCQQVDTLYLTINNPVHLAYHKTECETYTWSAAEGGNGQTYTTSGTYYYPHTDANQCQQVDTLYLTINNPVHLAYHKTECETYTWSAAQGGNGQTYTTSGTYYYPHADANQCQQVDTLYLTINNPVHQSYTVDACDSYKWVVGSWSQTYTTGGDKLYSHNDANGCLQVDTLHLTLGHSTTGVDVVTGECDSYTWIDGKTYTSSNNTATYTLTNAAGCDSVVTLNLTLGHTNPKAYRITECNSYRWINGTTYNQSAYETYAHVNETGCIDVDTLYLTINYSKTTDIYDTVCLGNAYNKNGFNIRMADIVEGDQLATLNLHTVHECDSTVTLHLHAKICDELCGQPVEDIDQNSYGTMAVHHLCWMTSNLRTTRYADETPIPFAIVYSYPYNPENTENLMTYGRLYNWASASKADATPMQGACPDGWRLPTQAEFDQLSLYYSESQLRSTDNWAQNAGTDESGFNKQPAGFYNATTGRCERLHATTHFYTADFEANNPIYQVTNYHCDEVHYEVTNNPLDGRSIRCVRDLVSQ